MDISGVQIGRDVRLLTPEDGSRPRVYHRIAETDEWCETELAKTALTGSFDAGDLLSRKPIACSGKHLVGRIANGQWQVWVDDYGAVGDEVTDDTAAIQAALDAAVATGVDPIFTDGASYGVGVVTEEPTDG